MKCPFCGCQSFYLKDPDDEYETYEFDVDKGEVNFHPEVNGSDVPELREETRCYCNQCAWNGMFGELSKQNRENPKDGRLYCRGNSLQWK